MSKKRGGKSVISWEECNRIKENELGWYVMNSVWSMNESMRTDKTLEYFNIVNNNEFRKTWMNRKKEMWECKRMYGHFAKTMVKQQTKKKHGKGLERPI